MKKKKDFFLCFYSGFSATKRKLSLYVKMNVLLNHPRPADTVGTFHTGALVHGVR